MEEAIKCLYTPAHTLNPHACIDSPVHSTHTTHKHIQQNHHPHTCKLQQARSRDEAKVDRAGGGE